MSINVKSSNLSNQLQQGYLHGLRSLKVSSSRLTSGLRINGAQDDVAGLSISVRLQSQIQGIGKAIRNNEDGLSFADVADGSLSEIEGALQKMREIAVYASNDTLTDQERQTLQNELTELSENIQGVSDKTIYNKRNLFDGTLNNYQFQIGNTGKILLKL